MENSIKIIIFTILLFFFDGCVQPKNELSLHSFDKIVKKYLDGFSKRKSFSTKEHIQMVKILNTLSNNRMASQYPEKSFYKEFTANFYEHYIDESISTLNAKITTGMCYYSREHDIYIGGNINSDNHLNSQYIITSR